MAKKRMFNSDIMDADAFLDMPNGAKLLYFYLGTKGDDDGFIASPRMYMRAIGCVPEDLEMLIDRGFVIAFDSGVIALRDWRLHNDLRNDRYHETVYRDEKAMLKLDASRRYALVADGEPNCIQTDAMMEAEHSIAEQSKAQHNKTEHSEAKQNQAEQSRESEADKPPRTRFSPPDYEEVRDYCRERNNGIDPQHFIDYYTANGWIQGSGRPIQDWKAMVRTWEVRERDSPGTRSIVADDTPIPGVCRFQ